MGRIKLDANENPYNLTDEMRDEIANAVRNLEFNRYPEANSDELKKLVADYYGVNTDQLTLGNGSDEVLGQLIYQIPDDKGLMVFTDDFSMYDFYAQIKGSEVYKYQRDYKQEFDVNDFVDYVQARPIELILFSNPHNPSGTVIDPEAIKEMLNKLSHCRIVVDEAYVEFYGKSMLAEIKNYDNLFVTRTLSKALGSAAIRLGGAFSNAENIRKLDEVKVPYNISSLNAAAASVILDKKYRPLIQEKIGLIKEQRDNLIASLQDLQASAGNEFYVYPSNSNFLLVEFSDKKQLVQRFEEEGIQIRDYANKTDQIRVTVGSPAHNERIVEIMKEVI